MDGLSYFWANEYRTREHLLELVEPLRHSDVGKVTWAVCNGDVTNYPSKVGIFYAVPQEVPIGRDAQSVHCRREGEPRRAEELRGPRRDPLRGHREARSRRWA